MTSLKQLTMLETQAVLLVSELELYVQAGGTLPSDVLLSMNNLRKFELLSTGQNDFKIKQMIQALQDEHKTKLTLIKT